MKQPYSIQKIIHHPDALDAMRRREPAPLIQVHFMPHLACSNACSFCCVGGTAVQTTRGAVPIEEVRVGDEVTVGVRRFPVTATSSREAYNTVVLIAADGKRLEVTPEHPIFTAAGFRFAGDLLSCDRIATTEGDRGAWSVKKGDYVTFEGARVDGLELTSVAYVKHVKHPLGVTVYNLTCSGGEAYLADGVLAHNCAYGHRRPDDGADQYGWKNMQRMSNKSLPAEKMRELVADWAAMRIQAIELTGGGEPLEWPHVDEFFTLLAEHPSIELALVTNGQRLTEDRMALFDRCNWRWARVSVDAGNARQYTQSHRVPEGHWDRAWAAVSRLAKYRLDPEQRVGVGYVVDRTNMTGVLACAVRAKQLGADNIRISAAFTPQKLARFGEEGLVEARRQAALAKHDLEDHRFQVNNLLDERLDNVAQTYQDYSFCGAKETLCVVGGDQNVYYCCSLAFNDLGLVGSIAEQSFATLWAGKAAKFACHNPRRDCPVECLYQRRNERTLELLAKSDEELADLAAQDESIHRNFL